MSMPTVNTAVQSFLTGTPGITTIYKAAPWELTGENWQTNNLPGTPAILNLEHFAESRIALGGDHGGFKQVDYDFALLLLYQYVIPSDLGAGSKDVWADGRNTLISDVITRMRSDRSFGCGVNGPIWEAANQDSGIAVHLDFPHWDHGGGKVRCWVRVEFKVTEIVPA